MNCFVELNPQNRENKELHLGFRQWYARETEIPTVHRTFLFTFKIYTGNVYH